MEIFPIKQQTSTASVFSATADVNTQNVWCASVKTQLQVSLPVMGGISYVPHVWERGAQAHL